MILLYLHFSHVYLPVTAFILTMDIFAIIDILPAFKTAMETDYILHSFCLPWFLNVTDFQLLKFLLHLAYWKIFTVFSVPFTRDISASFPFNKFGIILEYGGPCASSKISSMVTISDGLPRIHFIHVEFENHLGAVALCEGPDVCNHPRSSWVNCLHLVAWECVSIAFIVSVIELEFLNVYVTKELNFLYAIYACPYVCIHVVEFIKQVATKLGLDMHDMIPEADNEFKFFFTYFLLFL